LSSVEPSLRVETIEPCHPTLEESCRPSTPIQNPKSAIQNPWGSCADWTGGSWAPRSRRTRIPAGCAVVRVPGPGQVLSQILPCARFHVKTRAHRPNLALLKMDWRQADPDRFSMRGGPGPGAVLSESDTTNPSWGAGDR